MVAGTDGNDYSHRERVADQYSVSATNKARLKFLVVLHLLLGVLHNVRLVPFLLGMFGMRFPALPVISSLPLVSVSPPCDLPHVAGQDQNHINYIKARTVRRDPGYNSPLSGADDLAGL